MTDGNVIGLRLPEHERYVSRQELADLMGISVKAVDRMTAEGMPCETWGLRRKVYKASVALAWARTRGETAA